MIVDFIIAELTIWAVMMALLPLAVAIVGALTRRMSLPPPYPARRKRRAARKRAVSVINGRRPPAPPIRATPRP